MSRVPRAAREEFASWKSRRSAPDDPKVIAASANDLSAHDWYAYK
jgi:hypothetical protein